MKKIISLMACFIVFLGVALPAFGKDYRIEVLQVTDIDAFNQSYQGFLSVLEKNGIVEGQNLTVNRRIIDFDIEKGGLWKKVGVVMRIKKETGEIVDTMPDLVLTIGAPATKHAKDKIISAGIPLVFSAVAIPEAAGCKSLTESGPGFTGATLYMDMNNFLQIVRLSFPSLKTFGIIYTDVVEQVEEAKAKAPAVGMTVIAKEINKNDSIIPVAEELIEQGVQAFAVPLDTYYGMRDNQASKELNEISISKKIPIVSMALMRVPGAIIYIGSDFKVIGSLSAQHAVAILKDGVEPGSLPVLRQEDLKIYVDTKQMQRLGIQLPMEILQLAEAVQ